MARDRSLDLAVTGVSIRFPQCSALADWWTMLLAGKVLTTRLEQSRLVAAGVPQHLVDDPDYVPVRGLLTDADRFDNGLFRISPRDSELMDPQHRLMLETSWQALEDAGAGKAGGDLITSVFASGSGSGYLRAMLANGPLDPSTLEQALHGTEPDFVAGLISYKLGLTGAAMAVQTACSSGLVAVHLAGQALLNGDCDQVLVVAAGVDFPQGGHLHVPGGILSASGRCRPFDERADGVVTASGVVAVVLRRMADLQDDEGPEPYGVIAGTAINNDGSTKAGYFAPSMTGQEAVIQAAVLAADIDAGSLGYLETHGTGTRIGDPIEWAAASNALSTLGARTGQISIGALKANMGHLDAAAGLASLVRALLVVRAGIIAPVAGFGRLNPLLDAADSPLYVPTRTQPWSTALPRRAGVSAFGIGGTNAHVVIEQAPTSRRSCRIAAGPRLIPLSAADPAALGRAADRLAAHLSADRPELVDVAATLAAGRAELEHRTVTVGHTSAEVAGLLAADRGMVSGRSDGSGPAPLVLVFPGQGVHRPGMAVPYSHALPGFTEELERCFDASTPDLATRLRSALLDLSSPSTDLDDTELAQPALFALEYSAATALVALGPVPVAVLGHSLGELVAACVAGIFDLPDAMRMVAERGRAMQACQPGAMLAVACDQERATELAVTAGLELAAINAQDSCVLAGPVEAVTALQARLTGRLHTRRLSTARAFHSRLIEPAVPAIASTLDRIELHVPRWDIAANATGRLVPAGTEIGPEMFIAGARLPVRFAGCLTEVASRYPDALAVEIGPGRALSVMIEAAGLPSIALSPSQTRSPEAELLLALGQLWTSGQPVNIAAVCGPGRLSHLPGYPFAGPRWLAPELVVRTVRGEPPIEQPVQVRPTDLPLPAERVLAELWTELLGRTDLGEDSDFFALGGDSLSATHLGRRLRQELGIAVPLRDLLISRTLGRQNAIVRELVAAAPAGIDAEPGST
jgi:phthiocerol/phenolphthiocerol synthesis type-I polyketide synthase E